MNTQFNRWLDKQLHAMYDGVLDEPIPLELRTAADGKPRTRCVNGAVCDDVRCTLPINNCMKQTVSFRVAEPHERRFLPVSTEVILGRKFTPVKFCACGPTIAVAYARLFKYLESMGREDLIAVAELQRLRADGYCRWHVYAEGEES